MTKTGEVPLQTPLGQALVPVVSLVLLVTYGLIFRPHFIGQPALGLELIFGLASAIAISHLVFLGHHLREIVNSILAKLRKVAPALLILVCIGLVIGSWIACGTIPMLVYWGLKIVQPEYLYFVAFIAPIAFSTLTGTSWGSVGTIGVVLIGIAIALDANLGLTAGAVIGGAYFGDKLSPLSDTTNMAALAAEVNLYDHIRSMLWTTVPAASIAATAYFVLGWFYPPHISSGELSSLSPILNGLGSIFHFSWWLLLPPAIVLAGSLFRLPAAIVLIASVVTACGLALLLQSFSVNEVATTIYTGFNTDRLLLDDKIPDAIETLLNRGGLFSMNEPIRVALIVFIFIGTMDQIEALPTVVRRLTGFIRTPARTVLATLGTTAICNALTSNQYATNFIVGDAFKSKFDDLDIPRPVLSRSLEDTGTMIESLVPWHPAAIFMAATLGVAVSDYWHWQFLSLANFVIAALWAFTGIGCGYPTQSDQAPNELAKSGRIRQDGNK